MQPNNDIHKLKKTMRAHGGMRASIDVSCPSPSFDIIVMPFYPP